MRLYINLTLLLLLVSFSGKALAFNRLKIGDTLPQNIALRDLDNKEVRLGKTSKGDLLALVFFKFAEVDAYRDYSKEEIAHLAKLYDQYSAKGFKVLAVYCPWNDSGISKKEEWQLRSMIDSQKLPFPVVVDNGLKLMSKFGAYTLPALALSDSSGKVLYTLDAYPNYAEKEITQKVQNTLNIKPEKRLAKRLVRR